MGGLPANPALDQSRGHQQGEQDRDQVQQLTQKVQAITGETVEVAFVDEGYTGEKAEQAAQGEGIRWR